MEIIMMPRHLTVALAAALFVSTAATAQTLSVKTDLVKSTGGLMTHVDFLVTGYPGSLATIFVSAGPTLTVATPIPGLGMLYMRPSRGIFDLGPMKLDRLGIGHLRFKMPTSSLSGLVLVSQAIVTTKPGTMRLTSWSGIGNRTPKTDGTFEGYSWSCDHDTGVMDVEIEAAPGTVVSVSKLTIGKNNKRTVTPLKWGKTNRSGSFVAKFKARFASGERLLITVGTGSSAEHFEDRI
jgi:hypothetical protein